MMEPESVSIVQGSRGAHIAVPRDRVGNRSAVTLTSPDDGRVLFVLPSGTTSIIGSTETSTSESPDDVRASESEVRYLLAAVNHYFPAAGLHASDVIAAWGGIRPLAAGLYHNDPGSASREHRLQWANEGMLSVTGGKLTTYRVVARDAVTAVMRRMGVAIDTPLPEQLPGSLVDNYDAEIAEAADSAGDEEAAAHLVRAHGSQWRDVWTLAVESPHLAQRLQPALPVIRAEIVYAVREEMALTIADMLVRRTHVAFETRDNGRSVAGDVASLMAPELGWSASENRAAIESYEADVTRMFGERTPSGPDRALVDGDQLDDAHVTDTRGQP
jgi:glycerol-3-phosphate dehydrogenase